MVANGSQRLLMKAGSRKPRARKLQQISKKLADLILKQN
jgi:hypothetical protein